MGRLRGAQGYGRIRHIEKYAPDSYKWTPAGIEHGNAAGGVRKVGKVEMRPALCALANLAECSGVADLISPWVPCDGARVGAWR